VEAAEEPSDLALRKRSTLHVNRSPREPGQTSEAESVSVGSDRFGSGGDACVSLSVSRPCFLRFLNVYPYTLGWTQGVEEF